MTSESVFPVSIVCPGCKTLMAAAHEYRTHDCLQAKLAAQEREDRERAERLREAQR